MIRLYSYRFRIECTFRELKQQTGAFCYHFWSKHMPRLDYYRKKTEPSPLEQVENDHACRKILQKKNPADSTGDRNAYGIVLYSDGNRSVSVTADRGKTLYGTDPLSTYPVKRKRVGRCHDVLSSKKYFRFMGQKPELRITRLIQEMQDQPEICEDLLAS